jgi:tetratricopeptide (TPR) repeat protein
LHALGRMLWNRMPLPDNHFRPRPLPNPERNAACPCGSGQKYKRCCARADAIGNPFEDVSLLKFVLERYSTRELEAVPLGHMNQEELVYVCREWLREGRAAEVATLLARLFEDVTKLDERAEFAFDTLADCYDVLGRPKKKQQLIEACLSAPNLALRSTALHRKITILADRGQYAEAWRLFQEALRLQPDNPALATLEISLLLGQDDRERLRERGQFWIARLSRNKEHDYSDLVAHLRELVAKPDETQLEYESEQRPGVAELRRLIESTPPLQCHYELHRSGDEAYLQPAPALRSLAEQWSAQAGMVKPQLTAFQSATPSGWKDTAAGLTLLENSPLAWQCFDILDDLVLGIESACIMGDDLLLVPLLERARELLRLVIATHRAENCALPWTHLPNRPALRLCASLYYSLLRRRRVDEAVALAQWMVMTLNPIDNHGLREELIRLHLARGNAGAALNVCDRYPDDVLASTQFDRSLALFMLGRTDEAASALQYAAERCPNVLPMLLAPDPKRPRLDDGFVTIGGKDEAWLYREALRATWETSGGLEWARTLAPLIAKQAKPRRSRGRRGDTASATTATRQLLQLRVTLLHVAVPVWRRIIVPDDLTFAQLHLLLQAAMGWQDCHMHEFEVGNESIGSSLADAFDLGGKRPLAERSTRLRDVLGNRRKCRYWYDFGDDWWHQITIEKRLPDDGRAPRLIAGEGACPPEDCGGPPGYADALEAVANPRHERHTEFREWLGEFDPARFDLDAAAAEVVRAARRMRGTK